MRSRNYDDRIQAGVENRASPSLLYLDCLEDDSVIGTQERLRVRNT